MYKVVIIILLGLSSFSAMAKDRSSYLLELIDSELYEVKRLNKQIGARDPELLLRMAELYLERARVLKEVENKKFLSLSAKRRRRINKKKFFSKSNSYFTKAQKVSYFILKKFKRFKQKSEVFYILGFNAKEFKKHKKAKNLFNKSYRSSRSAQSKEKSAIALAEIYYNEKKFSKAISYYQVALKNEDSKWWTKDAHNLAWCFFREKQTKRAISLMKKVIRYSSKGAYLDLGQSAKKDLARFYAESDDVDEAIRFLNNGESYAGIISLAKNLIDQGKKTKAIKVLEDIIDKDFSKKSEFRNASETLINLYADYLKFEKLEKLSKRLIDNQLYDKELLVFNLKKSRSILQKKIVSDRYSTKKSYIKKLAGINFNLGVLLVRISPKEAASVNFYNAEAFFASSEYEESFREYQKAYGNKKNKKYLDGMMACLAKIDDKSDFYKKEAPSVFEKFILKEKSKKRKKPVLSRLFQLYLINNITKAENVLTSYNKFYKKDKNTIEAMLARILDHSDIKSDERRFLGYVKRINQGEFRVSKKVANKIKLNALSIQFKDVEKNNTRGSQLKALRGYYQIFNDQISSRDAKKNAAYNMAVLYQKIGYADKSYYWANVALNLMSTKDVNQFFPSFKLFYQELFDRFRQKEAFKLILKVNNKLCSLEGDSRKDVVSDYLLLSYAASTLKRSDANKICLKDDQNIKLFDELYFSRMINIKYHKTALSFLSLRNIKNVSEDDLIRLIEGLKKKKTSLTRLKSLVNKTSGFRAAKAAVSTLLNMLKIKKIEKNIFKRSLSFPEKRFNSRLKYKFDELNKITKKTMDTIKLGSSLYVAELYLNLSTVYSKLEKEISSFSPNKKSAEYVKSFKASMVKVSSPLRLEAKKLLNEGRALVEEKKLLSKMGATLLSGNSEGLIIEFDLESLVTPSEKEF
jgi:hypothetical protein